MAEKTVSSGDHDPVRKAEREAHACEQALDLPTEQGWAILERFGWNSAKRFDFPATEFVRRMRAWAERLRQEASTAPAA